MWTYRQHRLATIVLVAMLAIAMVAMTSRSAEAFQVPPIVPPIAGGAVVGTGLGVTVAGTAAGMTVGTAVLVGTGVGIVVAAGAFAAYKWWWADGHDPNHDAPVTPAGVEWSGFSHGDVSWQYEPRLKAGTSTTWQFHLNNGIGCRVWSTVRVWSGTSVGNYAILQYNGSGYLETSGRYVEKVISNTGHFPTKVEFEAHSTTGCTAHSGHVSQAVLQDQPPVQTDPERRVKTTGTCSDGSTVIGWSSYYREGSGTRPSIKPVTCPAGTTLDTLHVQTIPKVAGQGSPQTLVQYTRPPPSEAPETYRECFTPSSPVYPCTLQLMKVQPDGSLKPCTAGGECSGWSTDPNRDAKYACQWGPHLLGLEQCYALKQAYEPATPGQLTETPLLEPEPGLAPQPQPNPVLEPGTPTAPGPGPTDSNPDTDLGTPVTTQPGEGECFPNGWGLLNPIEWVLRPTKCALEWAFAPSLPKLLLSTQSLRVEFNAKPPGSVIAAVTPAVQGLANGWSSNGCAGFPTFFPTSAIIGQRDVALPCNPVYEGNAWWQAGYSMVTVAIGVGVMLRLWAMTSAAVGGRETGADD